MHQTANGHLLHDDSTDLCLPEGGHVKHNGAVLPDLSVSMPNLPLSCPSLYQSSNLLSEDLYSPMSSRVKLCIFNKLMFMKKITSLDGLRFASSRRYKVRLPIWLTLFFLSMAAMCWAIYIITDKYYERNTALNRIKHFPPNLNFPAVTICNHNPYYDITVGDNDHYNSLPIETQAAIYYEFTRRDRLFEINTTRFLEVLDNIFNISAVEFDPSVTLKTVLGEYGHKLEYGLQSCTFDGQTCGVNNFTEVVTAYGLCYTFNLDSTWSVSSSGTSHGLSLIINIDQLQYMYYTSHTAGIQVFIHPQDEYPYSGELHGFSVAPGFETQVAISLTNTKLMEPPYGQCGDRRISDPYIFPCSPQPANATVMNLTSSNSTTSDNVMESTMKCPKPITRYTRQRCLDECEAQFQNERCGCKADYLPRSDIQVCNLNDLFRCLLNITDQFAAVKSQYCDCPLECTQRRYDIEMSQSYFPAYQYSPPLQFRYYGRLYSQAAVRADVLSLVVYLDQLQYSEVVQKEEYSTFQYIADLGGHLGLFTGAGLLSFFELFELFLATFYPIWDD